MKTAKKIRKKKCIECKKSYTIITGKKGNSVLQFHCKSCYKDLRIKDLERELEQKKQLIKVQSETYYEILIRHINYFKGRKGKIIMSPEFKANLYKDSVFRSSLVFKLGIKIGQSKQYLYTANGCCWEIVVDSFVYGFYIDLEDKDV